MNAANRSPRTVACIACALLAMPALDTGWDTMRGTLGINLLETLIRTYGRWAFTWLLAALAMAPLRHALVRYAQWGCWSYGRRLSDWNWLIRLRRQVGLASFFYAVVHLALYVDLDLDFSWTGFVGDLRGKPYIVLGVVAFILLLPLAITSTDVWMRRLQRNWKRLHMLVYPAAVLAMAHFLLLTKPGVADPLPYGAALALLLVCRLAERRLHKDAQPARPDGIVPERTVKPAEERHPEANRYA
jgi:sulfoxide reductase heme-binding subunit YedZ